jgi:surface antigen
MRHLLAILLGAALGGSAMAQGGVHSLLKDTPAERFTRQDTELMMDAVGKTLEGAPQDEPVAWSNPATSARGDVTMTRAFESRGRACKELRVRNEAAGRKGETQMTACQVDGKWRLLSSSQLK